MITEDKIIKILEKLLKKAYKEDETPVAALIVYNNRIIAKAHNKRNKSNLTTDHAEIIALKKANKKLKNWRLNKCTIYITLEPCEMCKSVLKESRIDNVYYYIDRQQIKNQYSKTNFSKKVVNINNKKYINNYQKINEKFWKNKR